MATFVEAIPSVLLLLAHFRRASVFELLAALPSLRTLAWALRTSKIMNHPWTMDLRGYGAPSVIKGHCVLIFGRT